VYLGDVIVIGRTFQSISSTYGKCLSGSPKFNPEKCQLLQKDVRYLGHIVSPEGISTDPEKVKAMRELPTSRDKHEIRRLMRFIKAIEQQLREVVASHQRDWDERLPVFLLAYKTST
jgi:hypothetical protein